MIRRANINWNGKQIAKMVSKNSITFDNAVQRGHVWDKKRKSLLIHSMMAGYPIPPFYMAKGENGTYDALDGKQRCTAITEFLNDVYELEDIPEVEYEKEGGETEIFNPNGKKFSELPEPLQEEISSYSLTVYYFEGLTEDEVSEMFYRLNNGKPLTAVELTRVRAKSMKEIREIAKHELFRNALTEKALKKYTNEDIVIKAYAVLHEEEPSLETKFIRPLMESIEITEEDTRQLNEIFDRFLEVFNLIEDNKIAKRLLTRTHLISLVPAVWKSLQEGFSSKQFEEWFVTFFAGKNRPTISEIYNQYAGSGSSKKESVRRRLEEIDKSFSAYFNLPEQDVTIENGA